MTKATSAKDDYMLLDRFESESEDQHEPEQPLFSTPPTRKSTAAKNSVPAASTSKVTAVAKTPRPRYKKSTVSARLIPKSIKDCDDADKMLMEMGDAKTAWAEIREKWTEITGERVATSTLPNRYERLKSNFCLISEEDSARMIRAKRKLEKDFEDTKWTRVSELIVEEGGPEHNPKALQRTYKRMMIKEGARPPPGIYDADWECGIE